MILYSLFIRPCGRCYRIFIRLTWMEVGRLLLIHLGITDDGECNVAPSSELGLCCLHRQYRDTSLG